MNETKLYLIKRDYRHDDIVEKVGATGLDKLIQSFFPDGIEHSYPLNRFGEIIYAMSLIKIAEFSKNKKAEQVQFKPLTEILSARIDAESK